MTAPDLSGFGEVTIVRPLPGGRRNAVFLAQRNGAMVVAKSTTRTEAQVAWMVEVMRAATRSGLTVPELIPSTSGTWISGGWTLESYLEGTPPVGPVSQIQIDLAALRKTCGSLPQRPGFLGVRDLLDAPRGGDVDLSVMPDTLVALCRTAWRAVAGGETGVVHGDLNADNLRITPDGHVGVLDWDECRCDLVLFDDAALAPSANKMERTAIVAWEVAACWQAELDYARRQAAALRSLVSP